MNWVEARLCDDGTGRSRLAITHSVLVSDHWHKFGPGAVGVGWEMGLLGMELHLTRPNEPKLDGATFHTTRDGKGAHRRKQCGVGPGGGGSGNGRRCCARSGAAYGGPFTRATRSHRIDAPFRRAPDPVRCGRYRSWALTRHRGGDDCSDPFRGFDKVRIGKVGVACRGAMPVVPEKPAGERQTFARHNRLAAVWRRSFSPSPAGPHDQQADQRCDRDWIAIPKLCCNATGTHDHRVPGSCPTSAIPADCRPSRLQPLDNATET